MTESKYEKDRPTIPADIRRAVEVESGHECAVKHCTEHTYLEIHHINENREDNRVANLVLLCDKHHKMAHAKVIDRKALKEYKKLLNQNYASELHARIEALELLVEKSAQSDPIEEVAMRPIATEGLPIKVSGSRSAITGYTLEQVALSKFEKDAGFYLEREVTIQKEDAKLQLDALRQDDDFEKDVLVEVKWLRKRYLDGPVWIQQLEERIRIYNLITGRKAKGVLIFAVPKDSMAGVGSLPYTSTSLSETEFEIEVKTYTYQQLGFNPGAISASLFSSNIKQPAE